MKRTLSIIGLVVLSAVAGAVAAVSVIAKSGDNEVQVIEKIVERLKKYPEAVLLTTEKDAVKLRRSSRVPDIIRKRLFYMPMLMEFIDGSDHDFLGTLKLELDGKIHFDNDLKK